MLICRFLKKRNKVFQQLSPIFYIFGEMNLKKYLYILEWLPSYNKGFLKNDLIAGLTVSVMFVPQGMAYALLAGMPPIFGLYGGLLPLFLYALFGTSRHLSVGTVAVSSLLVLAGISQIAEPLTPEYISLVILTGLLAGIIQALASFMKLGFLANFLSYPVIAGFTSAAAIIIAASQLKYLLGFEIPRFSALYETFGYAFQHIGETHLPTFLLCISGIGLIVGFKKMNKNIPGPLIVVVMSILLVIFLKLEQQGINIVKGVPEGLPAFLLPEWSLANIKLVFPTVLTVSIMGMVETISIGKVWEAKHKNYKIDANQELLAIGISKIGGAFFQALPTSASFTRSAVNSESGAKTQMSSIFTSFLVALTLLFLTPVFYFLPKAILAAIVLLSVKSLFEYKEAINLWKTHRGDFWMMTATFIVTLLFGIEEGVLAGVVLSVLMVMYRNAQPHIVVLGQLPNTNYFRNVDRFPDAIQIPDCLIIRFDSQLFFANSLYFKEFFEELVNNHGTPSLKGIILDGSNINDIDSSGLKGLENTKDFLAREGIVFYLAGVIGPVRDRLHKADLIDKIGKENQFMYVQDALDFHLKRDLAKHKKWAESAIQTNVEEEEEEED